VTTPIDRSVTAGVPGAPGTPGTPGGPEHGVIHDIGYRHYQGARLGRGHIVRALYVDSLRGAYGFGRSTRSKVVPLLLLGVMCLPALVLAIVVGVSKLTTLPGGGYHEYVLNMEVVIAIYLAAQAPASVSRDLRFRVMSLYLSRPLRRSDYVAAKFAGLSTAVFALIAIPMTILFAGALLAKLPLSDQVGGYLAGLAGGLLSALVLSGIALVIAAITPRRGLGIAAIVSVLIVLIGLESAAQAIAVHKQALTAAGYLGMVSPFSLVQGVQTWLLRQENPLQAGPPGTAGGVVFCAVTVAVIAVCYSLLLLRYRKVSVS
jgi:ABC-2 type transport system permease protein